VRVKTRLNWYVPEGIKVIGQIGVNSLCPRHKPLFVHMRNELPTLALYLMPPTSWVKEKRWVLIASFFLAFIGYSELYRELGHLFLRFFIPKRSGWTAGEEDGRQSLPWAIPRTNLIYTFSVILYVIARGETECYFLLHLTRVKYVLEISRLTVLLEINTIASLLFI